MIALIQRVQHARVDIDGKTVGQIGPGLLALIGIERGDDDTSASKLADKLLHYRVFNDAQGKMNRNLCQNGGQLLLVPQFTLAADTRRGLRPSFSRAAPPDKGRRLFDLLCQYIGERHQTPERGQFGADMQVSLQNDGPVTFWLDT